MAAPDADAPAHAMIELDVSELAVRLLERANGMPRPHAVATAVLQLTIEGGHDDLVDEFLDFAEIAIRYFHECAQAAGSTCELLEQPTSSSTH
jgi:hypothetical protein